MSGRPLVAGVRRSGSGCLGLRPRATSATRRSMRFGHGLRGALVVALGAVVLSACKTVPPSGGPTPSGSWEERRAALQGRDRFDLTGRIAVAAAQEGFNAKLRWMQQGARSNLS